MLAAWPFADLIKVSEEELIFLTGQEDIERAARWLWSERLKLLVVTLGPVGCRYFTPDRSGAVPGFAVVPVDTTGAGDGFVAGLLSGLLDSGLSWDVPTLERALRLGNAVGALATTQKGAIPALPTRAAVEAFMDQASTPG